MNAPLDVSDGVIDPTWRISRRSLVTDDVWHLDILTAGQRPDQSVFRWSIVLGDGSRLTDEPYRTWLNQAKLFLYLLLTHPLPGRKRISQATIGARAEHLGLIMRWMHANGCRSFRALTPSLLDALQIWLRTRPGRRGTIHSTTLANYLLVLHDLYRMRARLPDGIAFDPFPMESAPLAAGVSRQTRGSVPYIPDPIAVHLLSAALEWIECHASPILALQHLLDEADQQVRDGVRTQHQSRKVLRDWLEIGDHIGPGNEQVRTTYQVRRLTRRLAEACFVVIAGFVGMRLSEILSMKVGAIIHLPLGATGVTHAFIVGRMFKTVDSIDGREERWLAPQPVVAAVDLLERLSEPLRRRSGQSDLFLIRNTQRLEIRCSSAMHVAFRIREFAAEVGTPDHNGAPWPLNAHQFRKTFARFVARRDRSQLLGLAEHFKHASVAMTARGYVANDHDLASLIDHEALRETAVALERFLASDRLAGRMGARITAINAAFRGRAGEQVRKDYVKFILAETDLRIHACDYGWCVFQKEVARCGGEAAPSEAGRSPTACLGCVNFVVDDRHRGYWQDRLDRNLALAESAIGLRQAVFDEAITECRAVLNKLQGTPDVR